MRRRGVVSGVLCVAAAATLALCLALVEACGSRTALEVPAHDEAGVGELDAAVDGDGGHCRATDASPFDSDPPGVFCALADAKVPCVPERWLVCPRRFGPGECFTCATRTGDAGYGEPDDGGR